jgi:hypothetical protein
MNVLVCLASQLSKELANVDAFATMPARTASGTSPASAKLPTRLSSVQNAVILRLAKQQLLRGGLRNSQRLLEPATTADGKENPKSGERKSSEELNYHDFIQQELSLQQGMHSEEFKQLLQLIGRASPTDNDVGVESRKDAEQQAQASSNADPVEAGVAKDLPKAEAPRKRRVMVPLADIWAQSVKGLIDVVYTTAES